MKSKSFSSGLTRDNALTEAELFIQNIPAYPANFKGRGIVICAGGLQYFSCAWVCINMLRKLGCELPIELWYRGEEELNPFMREQIETLNVSSIDALEKRETPIGGWALKAFAIVHSAFEEVLLLDADNLAVLNPEYLFDSPEFRESGSVFWPDYTRLEAHREIWEICGVPYRDEPEFESGQILVNKSMCWKALQLSLYYNEHADFYYRYIHGDKDTFHLAFRKLGQDYSMPPYPIFPLEYTMCQHDFEGKRIFQHRNLDKWNILKNNARIAGFEHEQDCFYFLDQLRFRMRSQLVRNPG